jgi:biotin synthase-related radical SAM superfamily protein
VSIEVKARLISIGSIRPENLPEEMMMVTSAGPWAGSRSIFLRFGRYRARLTVARESPLRLRREDGRNWVYYDGERLLEVEIEKPLVHCPEQAYITVSPACKFDCKFCMVPLLKQEKKSDEEVMELIRGVAEDPTFRAVSLTSGVPGDPIAEVKRVEGIIRNIKEEFKVPVGVSLYPARGSSEILYSAGADEIKYNVETLDRGIFQRICPGRSLDNIIACLREAVETFGENRVFSNLLIGLGEDSKVREGVEELASMGVIANLRPLTIASERREELMRATAGKASRPSAERMIGLARDQKDILDAYGLRMDVAKTMCAPCRGCELVPHIDF